ncbi:MAG: hypothetical protein HYW91_01365 [Candidatus Sungbacteria bacterium]|nr:hypothetical protein [Candidatus Sungbacteria bacterium]
MPRELLEQASDIKEDIAEAIRAEDRNGLLYLLKDLRERLTEREISEDEEEILAEEMDRFLEDKRRVSMVVLLGRKGGPPYVTIFREGESISFNLNNEYEDEYTRKKWEALKKAA